MTTFTPHQDSALKAVAAWLKAKPGRNGTPPVFRLFGYAGTGKTTLARHIADGVDGEVKFAAFTGKAALVMRNKGCDNASTIHSLIYRANESGVEQPSFELWDDAPASKAKLIVIDECSMVDAELGRDLMSFDCPLLVLGDPAQLPPIQGGGFFTDCEPDAMLTEVHRQAQDDPIVRMSMDIREGRELEIGRHGESEVVARSELDPDRVMRADQVLVGRNNTRRAYNMRVRQKQNIEDPLPVAGDKLVCLRNNRKKGLFNGGLWRVKSRTQPRSKSKILTMRLSPDEDFGHKVTKVSVRHDCFEGGVEAIPWEQRKPYDEFDYGYVLDRAQVAGLAMGRRGAVRREFCIPGQPRKVALHRHHAGCEAAERGGVTAKPSFRGDAKHRIRNLEIPRCAIAHLRSGAAHHPGMTQARHFPATK